MRNFWNDESGQDLIEYTLLLGFVALMGGALAYAGMTDSITTIWNSAKAQMVAAAG